MIPGISSYTYTWAVGVPGSLPAKRMTAFDLIDKACSAGLELVQIADNLPLELFATGDLSHLADYAKGQGISMEMGGRGLSVEHTMNCLLTAESVSSSILRMVIDSTGFEPDLQTIISIIRELLPEFKARKIKLAIENHDRIKASEFEWIIQTIGSEWVGICLDSVNSMGAGEGFETVSDILLPYTINLHIKDFYICRISHKMGFIIEGRPAGKGMLNIPDLLTRAEKTGRCNSAIIELWTPPLPGIEQTIAREEDWALESIHYLKSLLIQN